MHRIEMSEEERRVRDAAVRESWPLNDPRASYPLADAAREAQREGRERVRG